MANIEKSKKKKTQQLSDTNLEIQQKKLALEKFKKDCEAAREAVKRFEASNKWIKDKKQYYKCNYSLFGVSQEYDFKNVDIDECNKRVEQLSSRYQALNRNLDRNVLEKYDRVEKQQKSLTANIQKVKKDKQSIQNTIE